MKSSICERAYFYVFICAGCLGEYIEEIHTGKSKLKDRVCIYAQYIWQEKYQESKVEEHVKIYGNGHFKVFSF